MIIAIDYDNTYAADPPTFDKVIQTFQEVGHTVICVTARPAVMGQPVLDSIGKLVPVVFAGARWKKEAALARGYKVDVWIDDTPNSIEQQFIIK